MRKDCCESFTCRNTWNVRTFLSEDLNIRRYLQLQSGQDNAFRRMLARDSSSAQTHFELRRARLVEVNAWKTSFACCWRTPSVPTPSGRPSSSGAQRDTRARDERETRARPLRRGASVMQWHALLQRTSSSKNVRSLRPKRG